MNNAQMNVTLFIGSLAAGGAQRQALLLADGLGAAGVVVHLVTVFPSGAFWDQARNTSTYHLHSLYGRDPKSAVLKFLNLLWAPIRLRRYLKSASTDILYSMLQMSNLIARIATLGKKRPVLAWGIRASNIRPGYHVRIPYVLGKLLSSGVPYFIANSQAGLDFARMDGVRIREAAVIPNGIDCDHFRFSSAGRRRLREEWGVAEEDRLIGLVGRLHPMKGHDIFLHMATELHEADSRFRFVCVGGGPRDFLQSLEERARLLGIDDLVRFVGESTDTVSIFSAMDVVVSASVWGEGFPNVVGEAMACERPCVVSNVGDSSLVVGDCGIVVSSGNSEALAQAVISMADADESVGRACRRRISNEFSTDKLITRTLERLQEWL